MHHHTVPDCGFRRNPLAAESITAVIAAWI